MDSVRLYLVKLWFVHLPVRQSQLVSESRRQMPRISENTALVVLALYIEGLACVSKSFLFCAKKRPKGA